MIAAGKYADALVDLQAVSQMYGNTMQEQAEIHALRASALLGLPDTPEHRHDAADALVAMVHIDPEGTAFARASDAAQKLAEQIRSSRVRLSAKCSSSSTLELRQGLLVVGLGTHTADFQDGETSQVAIAMTRQASR